MPGSFLLSPLPIRQLCRDAALLAGLAEVAAVGSWCAVGLVRLSAVVTERVAVNLAHSEAELKNQIGQQRAAGVKHLRLNAARCPSEVRPYFSQGQEQIHLER